ncbi:MULTISPECIES: GGDEF domain-containing protein [unclassified Bradyrhizobium]|uniref:GGDEF domain-containing protein n=1 Tax=unclassified Bradyrhizobium TaxID=2631580 RepID=UPI0028E5AE65|nr:MULTISPECIES: GGDEF domain-containing protein [unclassified Bradyrhizobium]
MERQDPDTRRELVHLLYGSMLLVGTISVAAVVIGAGMAVVARDPGYAVLTLLLFVVGAARIIKLHLFAVRFDRFNGADIVRWERLYGVGAAAFALAVGALSARAFQIGDAPGIWICFGLSMAFCVGIVSRVSPWIVMSSSALLLIPTALSCLLQPEPIYRMGAGMLVLFWITLRGTSYRLTAAFTERIEAKQALARQANQDFLTGLPNRAAFLAALDRLDCRAAIVAIDLDGFKPVNDRFGHLAGDELLRQVAMRLRGCVGAGLAARFGGDEFMLLQEVPDGPAGQEAALALTRAAVGGLSRPFLLAGESVLIGASAGILITHEPGRIGADALLDRADRALYAAKHAGGRRWCWADEIAPAAADAAAALSLASPPIQPAADARLVAGSVV